MKRRLKGNLTALKKVLSWSYAHRGILANNSDFYRHVNKHVLQGYTNKYIFLQEYASKNFFLTHTGQFLPLQV